MFLENGITFLQNLHTQEYIFKNLPHVCFKLDYGKSHIFLPPTSSVAKSECYNKMCRSSWCASFLRITDVMAFMNFSWPDQKPYRFNFAYVSPIPRGDHKKEISTAALAVAYHRCVCTVKKKYHWPKKYLLVGNIFKATDIEAHYNLYNWSTLQPGTKEDTISDFLNC